MSKKINFGCDSIPSLFWRILLPTLLGMVCLSLMTIIDGIFVGRGIGSDALASVNIFTPLWTIILGISLMLGIGCSVVCSILLSTSNRDEARRNMTQTYLFGTIFTGVLTCLVLVCDEQTARIFGASDLLLPYVLEYQNVVCLCFIPILLQNLGLLVIRLDGSPKYAMYCTAVPSIINVVLDYVMLFEWGWGLRGIAIATAIGNWFGGLMVVYYMLFMAKTMTFYRLDKIKGLFRNIRHQSVIGFPALLAQLCVALLMIVGNYVFLHYLGEDGVAAFSVACYVLPFIYMNGNAVSQSVQPIISYNYGAGETLRVSKANRLSLQTAAGIGFIMTAVLIAGVKPVAGLFLESGCNAYQIALNGLPLLAIGFIPFIMNIVIIGNYQSVEKPLVATVFSLVRGVVLLIPVFIILPMIASTEGIWLAIPLVEYLALALIAAYYFFIKKNAIR